jgi:hypothetical protein
MTYFIFNTEGSWDSTTLYLNGTEFPANQLFIELQTTRDYNGNYMRNGLANGGQMTAYVRPQDGSADYAIFPGKIDLECPTHKLTIENETPNFMVEFTRVWIDGEDISNQVVEIQVNIDAVNDQVGAYVIVYKPHFLGADEVATYTLI